jgi:1,4-alpha-glucan branching enzyme
VLFTALEAHASRVSIVGDFNNWSPAANPLRRTGQEGIWTGVFMLPAGVYSYAYDVDGKTRVIADSRPAIPADEFGVGHSILVVRKESI